MRVSMIMRPGWRVFQVRVDATLLLLKSAANYSAARITSCPQAYALIPAAGSGSRMGAALPKQYLEIAGRPLLYHALRALAAIRASSRCSWCWRRATTLFARYDWRGFRRAAEAALLRRRDARGERVQRAARGARRHRRRPTGCSCTTRRGPASARAALDRLLGGARRRTTPAACWRCRWRIR